jgi:hypothetical protein
MPTTPDDVINHNYTYDNYINHNHNMSTSEFLSILSKVKNSTSSSNNNEIILNNSNDFDNNDSILDNSSNDYNEDSMVPLEDNSSTPSVNEDVCNSEDKNLTHLKKHNPWIDPWIDYPNTYPLPVGRDEILSKVKNSTSVSNNNEIILNEAIISKTSGSNNNDSILDNSSDDDGDSMVPPEDNPSTPSVDEDVSSSGDNHGYTDPNVRKIDDALDDSETDGIFKYYVETKDGKYAFQCTIGIRHPSGTKFTSMYIILDDVYYNPNGKINKTLDALDKNTIAQMSFIINQNRKGALDCHRNIYANGEVVKLRQWGHNCIKNYEITFFRSLDNNKVECFRFLTKDNGREQTMNEKSLVVTQYYQHYNSKYTKQILSDFKGVHLME